MFHVHFFLSLTIALTLFYSFLSFVYLFRQNLYRDNLSFFFFLLVDNLLVEQ